MPSRMLKLSRRLTALLLALVLLAPASSFGRILYSCGMTGRVTAGACCCQRAKAKAQQAEQAAGQRRSAQVENAGCCKTDDNRRAAVTGSLLVVDAAVPSATAVALVPAFEPGALMSEQVSWLAHSIRGPPPLAVFVSNCSLLI
jgi:hypothetical protein